MNEAIEPKIDPMNFGLTPTPITYGYPYDTKILLHCHMINPLFK
jgi:hypothetical protein